MGLEFRDDDGVFLGYAFGFRQNATKLVRLVGHAHGSAAQDVTRADEDRKASEVLDDVVDLIQIGDVSHCGWSISSSSRSALNF